MRRNTLFALVACAFSSVLSVALTAQTVVSPSGEVAFELSQNGVLEYRVEYQGNLSIIDALIQLELSDGTIIGDEVEVIEVIRTSHDETWQPVVKGRRAEIIDHYEQIEVKLLDHSLGVKQPREFSIIVRAYDDGVAFKYIVEGRNKKEQIGLIEENTEFRIQENPVCWAADYLSFVSHQEQPFDKKLLGEIPSDAFIGSPLLIQMPEDQGYMAITEGALVDSSAFYLCGAAPTVKTNAVRTKISTYQGKSPKVLQVGRLESSWRVVMLAEKLTDLFTNDIILNLNEPCAIEDPSWIDSGKMAWDHWWSGGVVMNTETIKEYIQLAADMGWKYQLIDWQWYGQYDRATANMLTMNPDVNMDEVRQFAKEKGVKLWLWLYWTDVNREDGYLEAFKQFEEWGISGIKIDFMRRDDQWMVNWYHKIVKAAADHKLMVDFHGAYKPTGWRRTYPNLMTREGVLGQEYSKWSELVTPEHNCTILYTRNLLGEMDYTPGGFLNHHPETFKMARIEGGRSHVMGTRAHNLALFVVYESPITCVCDHPTSYEGEPGVDLLKEIPTVWDETVAIDGAVGEFGIIAKRSGDTWYLGAIGNSEPRELEVDLSFLPEGRYQTKQWVDGPDASEDATDLSVSEAIVNAGSRLELKFARGGGAVAKFQLIEK
ncbi:MAG: glycoside hydrolase family 97 protein [Opitutales bacterium]|nr:glycoside hydrolase family 97 protein [Opitutales bacterium]